MSAALRASWKENTDSIASVQQHAKDSTKELKEEIRIKSQHSDLTGRSRKRKHRGCQQILKAVCSGCFNIWYTSNKNIYLYMYKSCMKKLQSVINCSKCFRKLFASNIIFLCGVNKPYTTKHWKSSKKNDKKRLAYKICNACTQWLLFPTVKTWF